MAIDFNPIMGEECDKEDAMHPPKIVFEIPEQALNANRCFQGIPTLERTKKGRILFAFYTGTEDEGIGNYVPLFLREPDSNGSEEAYLLVMPSNPETCRVYDPCLWFDPQGRLWFFVAQSYTYYDGRCGVWAMVCENPDAERPTFSEPRRIANGIMMNKPIVYQGDWLLPCAIWDKFKSTYNWIPNERFSNVYISKDNGKSFRLLSGVDYPDRYVDEHMMAELSDGRILMLIRGKHGIGMSISANGGKTWSLPEDSGLGGPCSRFCFKRLKNGRLLLVNHWKFEQRNNLTAMLSEDDGKTWKGYLMIDERPNVSYPDAVEAEDGSIYIIYDHERYKAKEILMARVTQEDILAGQLITPSSVLRIV
ncbi:MAG: exo-alpha-sialidase, partial [Ruminococcaceae bacterium]|nr:exo-alpha-sialidase [Oscillospiraceae bacterium]